MLRPDLDAKPLDAGPLADEQSDAVQRAFALLPPHCQRLLSLLVAPAPPSYKEISKALSMPIGSIGPTRGRCLERLRRSWKRWEPTSEVWDGYRAALRSRTLIPFPLHF